MKKIKVIRLEYETKDKITWKAIILAYAIEDAIESIRRNVVNFDRLTSTGVYGEVDLIDKNVYNDYFVEKESKEEVKNINEQENKTPAANTTDNLVCPVCNKKYKTIKTLVNHIKKYH